MRLFAKFILDQKTNHNGNLEKWPICDCGNKSLAILSTLSTFANSKIGQKWEKNTQKWAEKKPKWADNWQKWADNF